MKLLTQGLGPGSSGSGNYIAPSSTLPAAPAGPGAWLEQAVGSSRRYRAALVDPAGQPIAVGAYTAGDAVSAVIWEGGAGPALATPAAGWTDSDATSIDFTVGPADLAGLELQPYPLRLLVAGNPAWDGWISATEAPGTADVIPAYGTYADLLHYCGTRVAQFLTPDDRAGFLAQRGEARRWIDGAILARYRAKYTSYYGVGMAYTYGTGSLFPLGIGTLGYRSAPIAPDDDLKAALAGDGLVVTDRIREAAARKAGSLVFARQTGPEWTAAAAGQARAADAILRGTIAQVSDPADGSGRNYVIKLGSINFRDV